MKNPKYRYHTPEAIDGTLYIDSDGVNVSLFDKDEGYVGSFGWTHGELEDQANKGMMRKEILGDGWVKFEDRKPKSLQAVWVYEPIQKKVVDVLIWTETRLVSGHLMWKPVELPEPPVIEKAQEEKDEEAYDECLKQRQGLIYDEMDYRVGFFDGVKYARGNQST